MGLIPIDFYGQTVINLDCCYSGQWIEQAKELEKYNGFYAKQVKILAHCPKDKPIEWRIVG